MSELPLASIKRIASVRGENFRVGEDAVTLISAAAENFIKKLAEEAYVFTTHADRRTLKAVDVIPVLEKMGMKVPAVQDPPKPKPVPAKAKPVAVKAKAKPVAAKTTAKVVPVKSSGKPGKKASKA